MGLVKASGNMYPWVTHMHSHLRGRCPHECSYCYVQSGRARRFYQGALRLDEKQLAVSYGGAPKVIFIEHCNDLFASEIAGIWIERILAHCRTYPNNVYTFQTKNPNGAWFWREGFPPSAILGVTIETNRDNWISKAYMPRFRLEALQLQPWRLHSIKTFITIEPILAFDLDQFADGIIAARPDFINIGADSKGHNLPEPTWEQVQALIARLQGAGIEIREKRNLERLEEVSR